MQLSMPFMGLTTVNETDTITQGREGEAALSLPPRNLKKIARRHDVQVDTIGDFDVLRFGKGSSRHNRGASGKTSQRVRNERRWITVRNARRALLGIPKYSPEEYR